MVIMVVGCGRRRRRAKTGKGRDKKLGQTGERKNKLRNLGGAKLCGEILLRFALSGGSISPRHSQDSSWMHIFLLCYSTEFESIGYIR